jgi:hypothetical protein
MDQNNKIEQVLQAHEQYQQNTQELLRELRVPENLVQLYTTKLPNFAVLLPEEVSGMYQSIKKATILYFQSRGFSQRETARRLKGESVFVVNSILKKEGEKDVKSSKTE